MYRAVLSGFAASLLAVAAAATGSAQTASAPDTYPSHPAQIVVPFPPGGNTDILTRIMADQFTTALKQTFTVVNKPGAGANIGATFVANSDPDGYTILMAPPATHAINAYLYNNLPFDMEKSFAPITVVARFPNVMVVHPSLGVKTLEELIAKAKANPGKIDFATSGVGSTSHLCISLFMAMAGIEMNHIPYKGTSQSLQDVITGRVGLMIDNLGPILPHIQSGALLGHRRLDRRSGVAAARRAADRHGREGLSGEFVERAVGAGEDAALDRHEAQHRSAGGAHQAGGDREDAFDRLRAGRRLAGRRRKVLRRRAHALEARSRGGAAEACH